MHRMAGLQANSGLKGEHLRFDLRSALWSSPTPNPVMRSYPVLPERRASSSITIAARISPQEPLSLGPKPDFPSGLGDPTRGSSLQTPVSPLYSVELEKLLQMLPEHVTQRIVAHPEQGSLVEIVLDLGRVPIARFPSGDWQISDSPVSSQDLQDTVAKVGEFGGDNRAGVDRTLHRISAIRNRAGKVVGLTCRVGRAIPGGAEMVRDLVAQGGSMLLMGPPGVGKTTAIRDVARLLADEYDRRVVVVDTSNEIGGDGDVPHAGIGRARRMQVPHVHRQHEIMIEAVENHMPQTIVIDEIGTELEAAAACTISQRGVQLVGTAHGMTVDNLIKNPALQDLAGGIQSVTLGDEEARRRGVQKSVLERKGPPVFDCAVEMLSRSTWRVHRNLAATVDSLLSGKTPVVEIRTLTPTGQVARGSGGPSALDEVLRMGYSSGGRGSEEEESDSDGEGDLLSSGSGIYDFFHASSKKPLVLYLYQVSGDNLEQVLEVMGVTDRVCTTDDVSMADAVLALRSKLKQNAWLRGIAKFRQLPIYAIKSNTMPQMVRAMRAILGLDSFGPGMKAEWISSLEASQSTATGIQFGSAFFQDPVGSPSDGDLGLAGLATLASVGVQGVQNGQGSGRDRGDATPGDDWLAVGNRASMEDEIDALEEARLAVEQIVLPLKSPVELLPRSPHVLDLQTKLVRSFCLDSERVGVHPGCRIRILPLGAPSGITVEGQSSDGVVKGLESHGTSSQHSSGSTSDGGEAMDLYTTGSTGNSSASRIENVQGQRPPQEPIGLTSDEESSAGTDAGFGPRLERKEKEGADGRLGRNWQLKGSSGTTLPRLPLLD